MKRVFLLVQKCTESDVCSPSVGFLQSCIAGLLLT